MIDRSLARIAVEGIGRGQRGAEAEADLIAQPQKIPGFRNRDSLRAQGGLQCDSCRPRGEPIRDVVLLQGGRQRHVGRARYRDRDCRRIEMLRITSITGGRQDRAGEINGEVPRPPRSD